MKNLYTVHALLKNTGPARAVVEKRKVVHLIIVRIVQYVSRGLIHARTYTSPCIWSAHVHAGVLLVPIMLEKLISDVPISDSKTKYVTNKNICDKGEGDAYIDGASKK